VDFLSLQVTGPSWAVTSQLIKQFLVFNKPEGSSPCSQNPTTVPYPESAASSYNFMPCMSKINLNNIVPFTILSRSVAHPTSYSISTGGSYPRGKVSGAWS